MNNITSKRNYGLSAKDVYNSLKKDPMMINWSIEKLEDIVGTYRLLYSAYLNGDKHSFIRGGEAHAITIVCCADYLLNILKNIKL